MIISLVNQKGGVGKTTIAINMAYCIAVKTDKKTLLIDADPQASCLQWQSMSENHTFDVVHHPDPDFHKGVDELVKGYRWVIIDCPPGVGDASISAFMASALAIVPVCPSLLDMFSTKETVNLIKEVRKFNKKLMGKLLISMEVSGLCRPERPGKQPRHTR